MDSDRSQRKLIPPNNNARKRANSVALGFAATTVGDRFSEASFGSSWNRPSRSFFHGSTHQDHHNHNQSTGGSGAFFSPGFVNPVAAAASVREETASLAELALEDNSFLSDATSDQSNTPVLDPFRRRSFSRGYRPGSVSANSPGNNHHHQGFSSTIITDSYNNNNPLSSTQQQQQFPSPTSSSSNQQQVNLSTSIGHQISRWNSSTASPKSQSILPSSETTIYRTRSNNNQHFSSFQQQPPPQKHPNLQPIESTPAPSANNDNNNNNKSNSVNIINTVNVNPSSSDDQQSRPSFSRGKSYLSTILKNSGSGSGSDSDSSLTDITSPPPPPHLNKQSLSQKTSTTTPTNTLNNNNTQNDQLPIPSSSSSSFAATITPLEYQNQNQNHSPTSPSVNLSSSPISYSTPARTFRIPLKQKSRRQQQQQQQQKLSIPKNTQDVTGVSPTSYSPLLGSNNSTNNTSTTTTTTGTTPIASESGKLYTPSSSDLSPHLEYQTFHESHDTTPQNDAFSSSYPSYSSSPSFFNKVFSSATAFNPSVLKKRVSTWSQEHLTRESVFDNVVKQPIQYLPSVILGTLLNILDGLSYGMILFPLSNPIFANLGPAGLSMFYVSCVISQLVYSLGGSKFGSGVGSEMIEVVPFFHTMAMTLVQEIGEDKPHTVVATTITAFALSSIVTGLVFFSLGYARLGSIIGFFPRHILVGCIGGVGWFLIVTGLEVSSRLDGSFAYNWETLKWFLTPDVFIKWTTPLALAFILVFTQKYLHHPLLVPSYFICVFILFHVAIWLVPSFTYEKARHTGWLFQGPENVDEPWWYFYTLYDFRAVDYIALLKTIPAMFALTFFGILHVPINVPALAASIGEDEIDVDRELLAHGISNALSGFCGSIQNYLVYTNSVLFIRSGADSRLSGVMLAIATFCVMVAGPVVIGFIPVMVVGALIFLLGIELIEEALLDTWGRVSRFEYITIVTIVVTMGAWDFVYGIIVGILLACASFTIQASQTSAIKATFTGSVARSTVRRNAALQRFLFEVGDQIYVLKLSGNIFFGTIVRIEQTVRDLLDDKYFHAQPIRYLILDMAAVTGLDFSAAEAFARMKRLLDTKSVFMIISSPDEEHMIEALRAVGVLERAYNEHATYYRNHSSSSSIDSMTMRRIGDEPPTIQSPPLGPTIPHNSGGVDEEQDIGFIHHNHTHIHQEDIEDEEGSHVRLFPNLNSALEWCENQFLKDYYKRREMISASSLSREVRPNSSGSSGSWNTNNTLPSPTTPTIVNIAGTGIPNNSSNKKTIEIPKKSTIPPVLKTVQANQQLQIQTSLPSQTAGPADAVAALASPTVANASSTYRSVSGNTATAVVSSPLNPTVSNNSVNMISPITSNATTNTQIVGSTTVTSPTSPTMTTATAAAGTATTITNTGSSLQVPPGSSAAVVAAIQAATARGLEPDRAIVGSPRVSFLQQVADKAIREDPQLIVSKSKWQHFKQPLPLLLQTFQGLTTQRETFWHKVSPFFQRQEVRSGQVLYSSDTEAQGFYVVESGVLRADYDIEQGSLYEVILAGTTCGELPFFSGTYRTATVTAETDAIVWKLDKSSWASIRRLSPDGPEIANEFYLIALRLTVERFDSITAYTLISSR